MKNKKGKTIITYIIILILFGLFSIFLVNRDDVNSTPESVNPDKEVVTEKDEVNENELETTSSDLGHEYEGECKNIVKEFLKSYHEINIIDPIKDFEKAKDILVEPLYLDLKNEVIGSSSMETSGFIYRTIEDIKLYDYTFDDDSKDITVKAKVYSHWLDNDKNIVAKNELTEYTFLIINDMGKFKIAQLSSNII